MERSEKKDFTVAMALVDALPVLFFSGSILLLSQQFGSLVFLLGAACSVAAGLCKVLWKLVIALTGKDLKRVNKAFLPLMISGFLLMIISLFVDHARISIPGIIDAVLSLPSAIFFALGLVAMLVMIVLSFSFERDSAQHNWRAQIINLIAQASFFIGLLLLG